MKVENTRGTGPGSTRKTNRTSGASGSSFSKMLESSAGADAPSESVPTTSVDSLLAVQAAGEKGFGDGSGKQARARAESMLDRLDEIRHGMLTGSVARSTLTDLERTIKQTRESVNDPALNEILDEVELRAKVELAKLSAKP